MEGGLHNCGLTMTVAKAELTFDRWHEIESSTNIPWKDRPHELVIINFK